jgi:taurine dioxygenase
MSTGRTVLAGMALGLGIRATIVRGAVLRMTNPAKQMGRTCFINAIAAYDRLSDAMKMRIDGLEVGYEFNPDFASGQFGFPRDIRTLPRVAKGGWQRR